MEVQKPENNLIRIIWSVNYGSSESKNAQIAYFQEIQILDMLTPRYFAGLSVLTSEINPENFSAIS